jgi:hypothetical protein
VSANKETRVTHAALPKPAAAEIRETDDGLLLVVALNRKQIDDLSLGLITLDFPHHELHEGHHFFYTDSVALDSGNSQDYLLTTPNTNKICHLVMQHDGTAVTQFDFYEGADKTGVAQQTLFNNNRNSPNTPGLTIHKGTAGGSTDGTLLRTYKSGDATGQSSKIPSESRNDAEIDMKSNTKYIMRISSSTNGNLTNAEFYWYEVVPGES